jgi:hypothetical protein
MVRPMTLRMTDVFMLQQLEKIFDISCLLSEITQCLPYEPHSYDLGVREQLHRFLNILSNLRNSHSRYLAALMGKFNDMFPNAQISMPLSISPGPGSEIYENNVASTASSTRNESTPFDSMSSIGIPLRAGPAAHSHYGELKHSPLQTHSHAHSHSPMPHHSYVFTTSTMPYPDTVAVVGMGVTTSAAPSGIAVPDMYGITEPHTHSQGYAD